MKTCRHPKVEYGEPQYGATLYRWVRCLICGHMWREVWEVHK